MVCVLPQSNDEQIGCVSRTLREALVEAGCELIDLRDASAARVMLTVGEVPGSGGSAEAYRLVAVGSRIEITAPGAVGLFYGVQTLRQLMQLRDGLPFVPSCAITDWPAFRYRGLMHDVGRNFQSLENLEQQIDLLARYKLNVFHWHLTDNPGYRIECRKYPQLNAPENYRPTRNPGRFYTYAEINRLVDYCRERHITVVPEIDMPGHSEYFKQTFGVEMQDPKGVEIVCDLIEEFCEHVELRFFHIGSDEVRIRNEDFLPRVVKLLRERGKQIIAWRPGGPLPDEGTITQLWTAGAGALPGVCVLDSRAVYVNHMDPLAGIHRLFVMKPGRSVPDPDLVLGGILCYWPDNNIESEENTLRVSPVVPALVTFAERVWRGAERDREDLYARIARPGTAAFREFREFESDLIVHRERLASEGWPFPYVRQTHIPWRLIGPFDHEGELSRAFGPETEQRDAYEVGGKTYEWKPAVGGTVYFNHFFGWEGHFEKVARGTAYALTYIHSDDSREVDFWIQFGTPSTSARRSGGNPPAGKWSPFHGRIWVNGKSIPPPTWNNPGPLGARVVEKEIAFTNEGYHFREPMRVRLEAGWNRVLVRVPVGRAPGYRGGKWMFTCVPISWDGKQAREIEGIRFSAAPDPEQPR